MIYTFFQKIILMVFFLYKEVNTYETYFNNFFEYVDMFLYVDIILNAILM